MTERPPDAAGTPPAGTPARPPSASRKPRPQRAAAVAYGGSAAAFAAVLGALSWQLAAGGDPAIGKGEPAASTPPPKRVLVRRIVRRVVTTREPREAPAAVASSTAPAASAPAAPPASSAPATAPAPPPPAPAPAPAPPTTRSS
jgi:hypothetical protein